MNKNRIVLLLKKYKELIMYAIFGVLTTVVNFIAYELCSKLLNISVVKSTIIAWVISVLFAYVTNRIYVFESKAQGYKKIIKEITAFIGFRLLSGIMDVVIMYITVDKLGINDSIMKLLSNVIVIVANYIFSKLFIFNNKKDNGNIKDSIKFINVIKNIFFNNKFLIIVSIFMVVILIYTSSNTFLINDDLPYSFFYRSETRVTTIGQIVRNQVSDYLTINGRFFIHCIVQFLLMFEKRLWMVLNPIVIIVSIICMLNIYKYALNDKDKYIKIKNVVFVLMIALFLLIINLKYVNYWVAGSVNYTWIFLLIASTILYYLYTNMDKNYIFNLILFGILGVACEMSMVFGIVLLFGIIYFDYIKNRKINLKKLVYILTFSIGAVILLKAPGNDCRMSEYSYWYNMNIVDRLSMSIPQLSLKSFDFSNWKNIIPVIYFVSISIKLFLYRNKRYNYIGILNIISILCVAVCNNGWIYFGYISLTFLMQALININDKNGKMTLILLAMYAMSYSMILTPLFESIRTNYHLYMIFITLIVYNITPLVLKKVKIFFGVSLALLIVACFFEIFSFTYIGSVKREREIAIQEVKKNNLDVLELKQIKEPFAGLHPDSNCPSDNNYWAYRYFINFYRLKSDITIKLK